MKATMVIPDALRAQGKASGTPPPWFGGARAYARRVARHGMDAVRRSVTRGRRRDDDAKPVRGKRRS
jgi:hypothetical protein